MGESKEIDRGINRCYPQNKLNKWYDRADREKL